jgi:hypothetical protein
VRQAVSRGVPLQRLGFNPRQVFVRFVAEKAALGQVSPRILRFYPVSIISPVLRTRSFMCQKLTALNNVFKSSRILKDKVVSVKAMKAYRG